MIPPIMVISTVSSSIFVMVSCQLSAVRSALTGRRGTVIIFRSATASSSVQFPVETMARINIRDTSGVVMVQSIVPFARY